MRQRTPLAACPQGIQNGIDDFATEMIRWTAATFYGWH